MPFFTADCAGGVGEGALGCAGAGAAGEGAAAADAAERCVFSKLPCRSLAAEMPSLTSCTTCRSTSARFPPQPKPTFGSPCGRPCDVSPDHSRVREREKGCASARLHVPSALFQRWRPPATRALPPTPLFACRDQTLRPASRPAPSRAPGDPSAAGGAGRHAHAAAGGAHTFSRSILSVRTTSRAARKILKSSSRWSRSVSMRERPIFSGFAAACAARACSIAAAIAGSLSGLLRLSPDDMARTAAACGGMHTAPPRRALNRGPITASVGARHKNRSAPLLTLAYAGNSSTRPAARAIMAVPPGTIVHMSEDCSMFYAHFPATRRHAKPHGGESVCKTERRRRPQYPSR